MSDYFTAYRARLERNQAALIQLIKEVQEKDSTIEAYVYNRHYTDNMLLPGVVFIKDELINSIYFHQVPYRWSGCRYDEHRGSHPGGDNVAMPFTADDVISTFKPINSVRWRYKNKTPNDHTFEPFKNKEHYMQWSSYLTLYKPKD